LTQHRIARAAIKTLVTTALLCGLTAAGAADHTLRAVAGSGQDHDGLVAFKNFVESRSNGAIAVELLVGTGPCTDGTECVRALEAGSIDIHVSTPAGTADRFPQVQLLDLPYLLADDRIAERVLSGNLVRQLRTSILTGSDGRVRLMTIGNSGGWKHFANAERTVRRPADMGGLKIRTVVADLPPERVQATGAGPTPIPWPEPFTPFRAGVAEGPGNGITDLIGTTLPQAGLTYVTLDGHAYLSALWFMNNERFLAMPEDLRRVVVDGFDALQQATFASHKRTSIQAHADFIASGGELYVPTPEDKEAFARAVEPVYTWFTESVEDGGKWLDLLQDEASKEREANAAAYEIDIN